MFDLARAWPRGLERRSLPYWAGGALLLIAALYWVDRPVSAWLQAMPDEVVRFFRFVTDWGSSDWILIPSLALMLFGWLAALLVPRRVPRLAALQFASIWAFVLLGVGLPSLVSTLLKRGIGRGRPEVYDDVGDFSFQWLNFDAYDYQSFPSGHATTAFALAFVVGFLVPRLFWPALAMGVLVAISRMVLGAHYLTDVTGGFLLGGAGAYLVRNLFADRGWAFRWHAGERAVPRNRVFRRLFGRTRRSQRSITAP